MAARIHASAIVEDNVRIGDKTSVWDNVHIRHDSEIGEELRYIGLEQPGMLGALFMADPQMLEELTKGVPPVTDDFPQRIDPSSTGLKVFYPLYERMLDIEQLRNMFKTSEVYFHVFFSGLIVWFYPLV